MRLAATPDSSAAGAVRRAINAELTPRQRQLVTMYYLDQMLMAEIADELGLNVSSVSRTLARGRERLKKVLSYSGARLMGELDEL